MIVHRMVLSAHYRALGAWRSRQLASVAAARQSAHPGEVSMGADMVKPGPLSEEWAGCYRESVTQYSRSFQQFDSREVSAIPGRDPSEVGLGGLSGW